MTPPSLLSLLIGHWHPSAALTGEAVVVAAVYMAAARQARRSWPIGRTAAFVVGISVILVALESGFDAYDDRLLSVHMVQHLLLLVVAPVLIWAGQPLRLLVLALPGTEARRVVSALGALRHVVAWPACLGTFCVVVVSTHLPVFYDATLRHPALHDAEHLLYLAAGLLMWWPLLSDDPGTRRRLNGFLQLAYVIAAMAPMELIGALLSRQPTVVYAPYAASSRQLGSSAVIDQQHAGAIMWIAGGVLMTAIGLACAVRGLLEEERRQHARDRSAQRIPHEAVP